MSTAAASASIQTIVRFAEDRGRQLSLAATHSGQLARDAGRGLVRRRSGARSSNAKDDAALRPSLTRIYGERYG